MVHGMDKKSFEFDRKKETANKEIHKVGTYLKTMKKWSILFSPFNDK